MISQEPLQIPKETEAMRHWLEQRLREHFMDIKKLYEMTTDTNQIEQQIKESM